MAKKVNWEAVGNRLNAAITAGEARSARRAAKLTRDPEKKAARQREATVLARQAAYMRGKK